MNTIPVALFRNRAEAEPIHRRLTDAGIFSQIRQERWLQKLWFVSKAAAGIRLEVPVRQFERTEQLLSAWDEESDRMLQRAIHCPACKSLLVDYPQFARNSVITNFAAGLLAEVGLLERDYYCEHCHYTWAKEKSGTKQRHHVAPFYFIEGMEQDASATGERETRS
ncbi:MAG TPA: hypothetical protein VFE51_19815 [Verrucomicrobiae bacterium]|nr:hypothetical protein [Verrucomicrobiae bacterium]